MSWITTSWFVVWGLFHLCTSPHNLSLWIPQKPLAALSGTLHFLPYLHDFLNLHSFTILYLFCESCFSLNTQSKTIPAFSLSSELLSIFCWGIYCMSLMFCHSCRKCFRTTCKPYWICIRSFSYAVFVQLFPAEWLTASRPALIWILFLAFFLVGAWGAGCHFSHISSSRFLPLTLLSW